MPTCGSRLASSTGSARSRSNTPVDFTRRSARSQRRAAGCAAALRGAGRAGRGTLHSCRPTPRLAAEVKTDIFIQKYLPRTYRKCVPLQRSAHAGRAHRRRLSLRGEGEGSPEPGVRPVARRRELGRDLRLLPAPSPAGAAARAGSRGVVRGASRRCSTKGGFVYVDLAPGSAYAAQRADFDFLKRYAARIPALNARPTRASCSRRCCFRCSTTAPDRPFRSATTTRRSSRRRTTTTASRRSSTATQPVSQNLLAEEPDGFAPVTDIGIRLGWDDEQMLIWQNRQLKADSTVPEDRRRRRSDSTRRWVCSATASTRANIRSVDWHSLVQGAQQGAAALDGVPLGECRRRAARRSASDAARWLSGHQPVLAAVVLLPVERRVAGAARRRCGRASIKTEEDTDRRRRSGTAIRCRSGSTRSRCAMAQPTISASG